MSLKVKGKVLGSGELVEIGIDKGFIQTIQKQPVGHAIGPQDLWLAPAFFDIQVNGFAGSDFNAAQVTSEALEHAMIKLRERGVALFCPTVITQSFEHMASCFQALARACDQAHIGGRVIPSLHMEGPYISPQEGPRGDHSPEHYRPASWDEFQRLQESANGMIGLL